MILTSPGHTSRIWKAAAIAAVGLAFLIGTGQGLFVGFDGDDLMNLHEAVIKTSAPRLLFSLAVPFTSVNRPTGELYYGICFAIFGWHPFGFRLVTYLLLVANVGLVAALARRLTASSEAGFLAALLFSFHGRLWQIYLSNATVYDVLCVFFSLLTMHFYSRVRLNGKTFSLGQAATLTALFVLALNSKEMAAVVPVVLLLFDWFYCNPGPAPFRERIRWMARHSRLAAGLVLITAGAAIAKTGAGSALENPAYAMSFTRTQFLHSIRLIYSELFYLGFMQLTDRRVILLWLALFATAALSRRKALWFLAWFVLLAPLPILFIPWRGFFVMYFPMVALSCYAAIALLWGRDTLLGYLLKARAVRNNAGDDPARWNLASSLILAAVVLMIVLSGLRDPVYQAATGGPTPELIEQSKADFLTLHEPIPEGARILLLNSRFSKKVNEWYPLMIAQLLYGDRQLELYRPTTMNPPPDDALIATFDRVLDFSDERLTVVRRRSAPPPTRLPSTGPRLFGLLNPERVPTLRP